MALPVLDRSLTKADWKKKKGKLAPKSGVGQAMDKVGTSFKAVDFTKFDAKMTLVAKKDRNAEGVERARKAAAAEYKAKVEPLRKDVKALRDLLDQTAKDWKKKKMVPSSSTKYAEQVAKTADVFWIQLKSLDSVFDQSAKLVLKEAAENRQKAEKMLSTWVASIEKGVAAVKKSCTLETYNKELHQKVRGLGTAVANLQDEDQYKPWLKVWGNQGFSSGLPNGAKPDAVKKQTQAIEAQLKKFKASTR